MSEQGHIEAAIADLEARRRELGDTTVDVAIGVLRARLVEVLGPRREQRKLVTVLFGDVSGFTALVERTDPEEVTAAVNALWRRVDTTIAEHGGTVDKHIGDAVMALFGAPTAREDDAERAVRAALAIQAALRDVTAGAGWAQSELRMRIGLHTRHVHLATVGTTGEYTAMGDTVNLASRLQALAPEGGVLVSHETWRLVRDTFDAQPRPPMKVKGRSEPIRIFEVREERPPGFKSAAYEVAGVETPFVGRDETLLRLGEVLDDVNESRVGRVLALTAERGLGKSRTLNAFLGRVLDSARPVSILRARASRHAGKVPYGLVRDLVATRFRVLDSDSDSVALAKLESGLQDLVDDRAEEIAHLIGHLVGLDAGQSKHITPLLHDPRNLREQAFSALIRMLRGLASRNPLLLALENLHLTDDGSRRFVRSVCQTARSAPFFVLMTARPSIRDLDSSFIEETAAEEIALEPLCDADAERLVRAVLSRSSASADHVASKIVETAGGHPYFLEELARMVLEESACDAESESSLSSKKAERTIPSALTSLLQARLDALPDDARSLLQCASVFGRVFWPASLAALRNRPADDPPIQRAIQCLVSRELVLEEAVSSFDGLQQLAFRSSLLQEVAYETVLLRDRRSLHGHVARWLSEQAGDAAPLWAGRIAEHWERTNNSRMAAAWFLKAGEYARRTSSFGDAEDSYQKALEHMLEDPGSGVLRVAAYEGLCEMLGRQAKNDEARAAAEELLAEAEALNDEGSQARAWWTLCRAQQAVTEFEDALVSSRRAVELAKRAGAGATLVRALIESGLCLLRLGRLDEAASVLAEGLDAAREEALKPEQALALRLQGAVQARLGRFAPAERYGERALELLQEVGDSVRATACLFSLGELARVRGDLRLAAGRYDEALRLARRLGASGHELVGMGNLGGVMVALGKLEDGEALLREVLDRAPPGWYGLPETYRFLAEARLSAGDIDGAMKTATETLKLSLQSGNAELIGPAWRVLGEVAGEANRSIMLENEEHDARTCFETSRRILADAGLHPEEARTLRAWARHEMERGDKEQGEVLWAQAREWFELLGMDVELARIPKRSLSNDGSHGDDPSP